MKTAKWISLGLLVFSSTQGLGAQEDSFSNFKYQRSTYTEKLETKEPSLKGLSLVLPSFVVHGVKPTQLASDNMPRKMDGNGSTVMTPGFGLQYVGDRGLMLLAAFVKDCYDNPAGTLQIGEIFELSDRTNWGLTFGVYARQTPMSCSTWDNGSMTGTDCVELDTYRLKFMSTVNGHSVDIIPMPFLHFTTALYKSRDFRIDFKVMSNVVLNEFGVAVPF
ncbi:MAG: hypothetical protein J7501_18735 [Bdellovibrio sp.]|nr:hypothetical protein [Bdellovibrio sp.]